jgi:TrmH family RNA methyltransferase
MSETTRIESVENPKVKDAVRLRERRARRKTGRFLVEGAREILRALDAGLRPATLFVEPSIVAGSEAGARALAAARASGVRPFELSSAAFAKIAMREERDGLVAVFPIPDVSPGRLRLGPAPLVLCVAGVEKPGNLGAVLRSADAFGVDALVVDGGVDPWSPNVVRASLGCLFTVPLAATEPGGLLRWLKETGLRIVASTPDGDAAPHEVPLGGPVAIVLGGEERGLEAATLAEASARVRIPMRGSIDSLNVSVAAGVLLYEAVRQRASA